jgi:putative endonuclease
MWSVYVLRSQRSGRYYVGCTNDLVRRLAEHNSGQTRSTRSGRPWEVAYVEAFEFKEAARASELEIKSWKSRRTIEERLLNRR